MSNEINENSTTEAKTENKWLSRKFIASAITLGCMIWGNVAGFEGEQIATLAIPIVYVIIEGIRDIVIAAKK